MLTSREPPDCANRKSAFHLVSPIMSSSPERLGRDRKRDSGYGSDFSPAGPGTPKKKFTFDDADVRAAFDETNCEMDVERDDCDDVFMDHFETIPEDDESDGTDKEVEELLSASPVCHVISDPIPIGRPPPPAPSPSPGSEASVDFLIASPFYHTQWTKRERVVCKNPFRPIVSRSVGTQTPSPHCQLIQDVLASGRNVISSTLGQRGEQNMSCSH